MSGYETDEVEDKSTEALETEPEPVARKKYAPIKDVAAKRAQALKNLAKARATKMKNVEAKKKKKEYQYEYLSESSSSESEEDVRPTKKKHKKAHKSSSFDDEFKQKVLQELHDLRKKAKKPARSTVIHNNIPPANVQSSSSAVADGQRKKLLDMFN
jgi:hypothetical protein